MIREGADLKERNNHTTREEVNAMPHVSVDLLHVVVAAILMMVIGAVWYSKALFGKMWGDALGKKMEDFPADARRNSMLLMAVGALVMSYVLAIFVGYAQATTIWDGKTVGFLAWLGFVAASALSTYAFEGRAWKLYYLFVGYQLIALVVAGALLASWH
jgi:hypothetical protein